MSHWYRAPGLNAGSHEFDFSVAACQLCMPFGRLATRQAVLYQLPAWMRHFTLVVRVQDMSDQQK